MGAADESSTEANSGLVAGGSLHSMMSRGPAAVHFIVNVIKCKRSPLFSFARNYCGYAGTRIARWLLLKTSID